jgi:hypothetical protein
MFSMNATGAPLKTSGFNGFMNYGVAQFLGAPFRIAGETLVDIYKGAQDLLRNPYGRTAVLVTAGAGLAGAVISYAVGDVTTVASGAAASMKQIVGFGLMIAGMSAAGFSPVCANAYHNAQSRSA